MQEHQQRSKLLATLTMTSVLTFFALTSGTAAAPPESSQAVRGSLIPAARLDGSMSTNWNDLTSAFLSTADGETKVLLAFKGHILTASAQDGPPTVSITVTPKRVEVGKIFKVTVEAEDDINLQAMWWWAENSGIAGWDKAHFVECSDRSSQRVWEVTAVKEGTFAFAANARDSAYPTPGEAHQASEGEGIVYATITVTRKEIPIPSATIVDFGPDVPASIQYSSTMGQSIWVKGQKFAPNHTYIFKWKKFSANPVPCEGEVITNAEGSFDGTITLPAILPYGV